MTAVSAKNAAKRVVKLCMKILLYILHIFYFIITENDEKKSHSFPKENSCQKAWKFRIIIIGQRNYYVNA